MQRLTKCPCNMGQVLNHEDAYTLNDRDVERCGGGKFGGENRVHSAIQVLEVVEHQTVALAVRETWVCC